MTALCSSSAGPLDFSDACVRGTWAAFVPAALVGLFLVFDVALPALFAGIGTNSSSISASGEEANANASGNPDAAEKAKSKTTWAQALSALNPTKTFMDLREAEALDVDREDVASLSRLKLDAEREPRPLWLIALLSLTALLETGAWLAVGTYALAIHASSDQNGESESDELDVSSALRSFLTALTWLYASIRPLVRPKATPDFRLVTLYFVLLAASVLVLCGNLLEYVDPIPIPSQRSNTLELVAEAVNVVMIGMLIGVQMSRPLAYPISEEVKRELLDAEKGRVGPEEYTTLWGWTSFGWVSRASCSIIGSISNPRLTHLIFRFSSENELSVHANPQNARTNAFTPTPNTVQQNACLQPSSPKAPTRCSTKRMSGA